MCSFKPRTLKNLNSTLLAIIACILWATAFAGIKIGLEYTTPLRFAGIRFMLAGLMVLPFCTNLKAELKQAFRNIKVILLFSLFQTFGLYTFFYLGIAKVSGALTAMIVGGGPLFVALMAHFVNNNEKMTPRKIFSILIGFVGIAIIATEKFSGSGSNAGSFWGISFLLLSNISGSIGNIVISKKRPPVSPFVQNAVQIFTGGLSILILSFVLEPQVIQVKAAPYYISLIWLSFISAMAFSLWFMVLQRPGVMVSEINIWKFIIPVLGAVLSWILVKGEEPTLLSIAGMILVGLALIVINYKPHSKL